LVNAVTEKAGPGCKINKERGKAPLGDSKEGKERA
jgi:hypothetical protein